MVTDEFQGLRITPNVYTTLDEVDLFADRVIDGDQAGDRVGAPRRVAHRDARDVLITADTRIREPRGGGCVLACGASTP